MDKREMLHGKIFNHAQLKRKLAFWRYKDQRITMAYGTFEILKPGNVDMLVQAANQGDALLVVIRSDKFIQAQKGKGEPQYNQFNRSYVLASQLLVSGIYIVEEEGLNELVELVHPCFIAYCKNTSEREKKLFQNVVGWGGEFAEFDTDKILVEPVSIEGDKTE